MIAIEDVSPVVFGAGAFNWEYDQEPALADVRGVVKLALDRGVTALDTAAAYGPSEELLGRALEDLAAEDARYARDQYFLTSKAGRGADDTFDFSDAAVRHSVARSLERLRTPYLDLLLVHDVEFGSIDAVVAAVATARALQREGKARYVGISGYPLPVLKLVAQLVRDRLGAPLDAVLSYCNLTLQNGLLRDFAPGLHKLGVRVIFNASPLSMSLLRSRPTHGFHPAQRGLRKRADAIAQRLGERGIELADVALQFSFASWDGPTVVGLRTTQQVEDALANREKALADPQRELWAQIIGEFGEYHNYTWPSP